MDNCVFLIKAHPPHTRKHPALARIFSFRRIWGPYGSMMSKKRANRLYDWANMFSSYFISLKYPRVVWYRLVNFKVFPSSILIGLRRPFASGKTTTMSREFITAISNCCDGNFTWLNGLKSLSNSFIFKLKLSLTQTFPSGKISFYFSFYFDNLECVSSLGILLSKLLKKTAFRSVCCRCVSTLVLSIFSRPNLILWFSKSREHPVKRDGEISSTDSVIWAPSSEFVSSSIPSLQILTAHAQPFRGARDLAFCLKVPLDSLLVWASSGGSGETARMRRLAWTFAARIGNKYQIRLTRSI